MEINGPPATILTPRLNAAANLNWQVGQILQALVLKQESSHAVILQINQQQYLAETSQPVANGQRLQLTVLQLGEKPVLQATPAESAAAKGSNTPQPRLDTGPAQDLLLKQALPKQSSTTALLANIAWLNTQQQSTLPVPNTILELAKRIYQQSLDKNRLGEPQQLKNGIANSGIFLENKLAGMRGKTTEEASLRQMLKQAVALNATKSTTPNSGAEKMQGDMKAQLLRLLGAIRQVSRIDLNTTAQTTQPGTLPEAPPPLQPTLRGAPAQPQAKAAASLAALFNQQTALQELGKQTEAALARTQLHQAASLGAPDQPTTTLAFELPIRNGQQLDLFDIVIEDEEQQQQDDDGKKHPWSVTLAFDLDGLGPVHARLRLEGNKVSTLFWAENAATSALFNQHLNELMQRYRQSGIEAGELRCYQGSPPEPSAKRLPRLILDVNV